MARFKDHFSGHAASYSAHRPTYPAELFDRLAALAPSRALAVDIATGSGQAAVGLAEHFDQVVGIDASAEQIRHAAPHARVRYDVAPAEENGLPDHSADLVTVAQALHWFDHARFAEELRRVLRPAGIFAAWTYGLFNVDPAVDALILDFYSGPLDPYWPPGRLHVETGYTDIAVPGEPVAFAPPPMTRTWTASQGLAYLGTWSATQRLAAATGADPIALIADDLREAWGEEARLVEWPVATVVRRLV